MYKYKLNDKMLELEADLALSKPLYIFHDRKNNILYYSDDLVSLLDHSDIKKPLKVSREGISFLLQSGVVPPPNTVYENVYIVGLGMKAIIRTVNDAIDLSFEFEFPFLNSKRREGSWNVNYGEILDLIFSATIKNLHSDKSNFLFHSAGKDSNTIAIALAEAGRQNDFTLVTHKTKRALDESGMSLLISKRLGFKHVVLNEVDLLEHKHIEAIEKLFENAPLPCTNNISILYPLYTVEFPDLINANVVDGSGNDVYIGHIPGRDEYFKQKLSCVLSSFRGVGDILPGRFKAGKLFKTRAEWTGLYGLSMYDARKIYSESCSVGDYWRAIPNIKDYFDYRAVLRGCIIDTEVFMRKVRNFSDAFDSNVVFPWADADVARYFMDIPEQYLFDRKNLRNKIVLRNMIKDKIDIDSDVVGKRGFPYDLTAFVANNLRYITSVIIQCELWDADERRMFIEELSLRVAGKKADAELSALMIYHIFTISGWYNYCRWV